MRTCPHCQHAFAPSASPPAQCPACGRQLTVADLNAATLEFDTPAADRQGGAASDAPRLDATLDSSVILPGMLRPAAPTVPDVGAPRPPSAATEIGMTIQSGKISLDPAEMDGADEVLRRLQAGAAEPLSGAEAGAPGKPAAAKTRPLSLNDMTAMWDSQAFSAGDPSDLGATAESSLIAPPGGFASGSGSGGASGGSSQGGSQGLGSGDPPGGRPGSSQRASRGPGGVSSSLEESLVIQPRVLRRDDGALGELAERIDYNLLKKLGEGGMGVVYAARQESIRRTVALKMLKPAGAGQTAQREKFLAEAVITGDLEHPNIVPIYDLGRDEAGAIFYAMKHVKGTPWDKLLPKKSQAENLEILLKAADGVAFAHARGVVHRDLKPENIMLGEFGEVLVMDWGLALSLKNPPAQVAMGGTPAYMAPEMTFGPVGQINETSDVYLLGAILFEIVTGQRPHGGPTVTRCLMSAAKNEIVPVTKTGELVDIARKAMATRQEERYPSVRAFQAALREYQSHTESIALAARAQEDLAQAQRSEQYETFARALFAFQEAAALWDGNSRAQAGVVEATTAYAECSLRKGDYDLGLSLLPAGEAHYAELRQKLTQARDERDSRQARLKAARRIGVGLVALILVVVTGAFFWIRAEARRARAAEQVAQNERAEAVRQKQVAEDERARAVAAQKAETRHRQIAEEQRQAAETQRQQAVAAREAEKKQREAAEAAQAQAIAAQKEEARQRKVADEQRKTAEDERSKALAAQQEEARQRKLADEQRKVADEQRTKAVAAQREEERQRKIAQEQTNVALAARQEEQKQREAAEEARRQEEYESYIAKLGLAAAKIDENAFDHAQQLLRECPPAYRNWEWGRLAFLCTRDERTLRASVPLETLALAPDGKQLAVGGWSGEIILLDSQTGAVLRTLESGAANVFALAYSPDGKTLAAGTSAKPEYVALWDVATGKRTGGLSGHTDAVLSVRFSRSGRQLLTSSYDNTARLYDLDRGGSRAFRGHDWWVWSAEFSPDESQVVTASQDGSVMVWDVASVKAAPPFLGHRGPVFSASFSPDGKRIASGSHDRRILLWEPSKLREPNLESLLGADRESGDESPAAASAPYTALSGHAGAVRSVQFSASGKLLASAGYDNVVAVWDVGEERLVKKFRGHASRATAVRFDASDERIFSAGLDRQVKVWRIAQYEEIKVLGGRVLRGHRDAILGAAFSPTGETIVTASRDRTAAAWDATTGARLRTYDEGHQYLASAAWCFPDGKRVLTAAGDNTSRVWDVATGAEQAALVGTGPHAAVALAPSGAFIVSGSDERSLKVWSPDGKLRQEFRGFPSDFTAVTVSPDERSVLTGDAVGRVRLLSLADGATMWESRSHSRAVTSALFLGSGDAAATASLDHTVALWNTATGNEDAARILKHPDAVTALAVSPDGKLALTACADKRVRVWSLERAAELRTLATGDVAATRVALASDSQRALIVTADNRVRMWNAASGAELTSGGGAGPFLDLAATTLLAWSATFTPAGDRVLTVGGAEAHLWDAATAKLLVTFAPQSAVSSVQFSPAGGQLLTGGWDNAARIWNAATGASLLKLGGVHTRFVNASAFSPNGKWVVTASDDHTARLWDAATGKPLLSLTGHTGGVTDVAFSPDGARLITASHDKTARIWEVATGKTLQVLAGHSQAVLRATFTSDGSRVATGGDDATARLWNATTGQPLGQPFAGHTASVTALAFSRDGLRLFTGGKDAVVKVWDPATGKEILTLAGHSQEVTVIALSPDGRRLLTGGRDGIAIIWDSQAALPATE